MNEQRALLDQLMGLNRDGDRPEAEVSDFRDRRVCKKFLVGLCVHDLFSNTKMDMGECAQLHLPALKKKYEEARKEKGYGYEYDLEKELVRYHNEVTRKIEAAQRRLAEENTGAAAQIIDVHNSTQVLELTAEIQEALEQAEKLGMEGFVDQSLQVMTKVDELSQKRASAQASAMLGGGREIRLDDRGNATESAPACIAPTKTGSNVNQKLRVCDVCGAFLSIFDSDRRLADHFGGKLHLGYLQIKKKIEEIRKLRESDPQAPQKQRSTDSRRHHSTNYRSRRRSRSRSRDRRRR